MDSLIFLNRFKYLIHMPGLWTLFSEGQVDVPRDLKSEVSHSQLGEGARRGTNMGLLLIVPPMGTLTTVDYSQCELCTAPCAPNCKNTELA